MGEGHCAGVGVGDSTAEGHLETTGATGTHLTLRF